MAIALTTGVVHLPFGQRPGFGDPYPEGIAVAQRTIIGDATGGTVSLSVLTDGGFLYRVERAGLAKGDAVATTLDVISVHRWATARSGLGDFAFDLNWILPPLATGTFSAFGFTNEDWLQLRRFPMGRTERAAAAQQLFFFSHSSNVNTITYEFDLIMAYWSVSAAYRPGFLESFWEAPPVPIRGP